MSRSRTVHPCKILQEPQHEHGPPTAVGAMRQLSPFCTELPGPPCSTQITTPHCVLALRFPEYSHFSLLFSRFQIKLIVKWELVDDQDQMLFCWKIPVQITS